ncbi:PepSY-associated TM helix domain-containing protein [Nocardioides donggukensis]|uniref:PepSY domain-containing protein n=1 Tax=Nocardioides donggukensis TaxID=2774019 RepID=A0A927Q2R8_9ACTN|nr:PepSY domain-containing protein [Nocardioides donggukensis]MBD8869911.1 PepSY domain-containing protein [Nocardioides donggukensis]
MSTSARPGWFRAFWRWHFYAAFLVVPVLLVLATTGLIYLFRFQLEPLMHADLLRVDQPADVDITQPYAVQQAAVERELPDSTVVAMTEPGGPDESTRFSVVRADGSGHDVYVDPWRADVLGSLDPDTTLSGTAVRLHADLMSGVWGDRLIELAACWAIVMALTGYFLFFKGRAARRRSRAPGARLRSRHAAVGSVVGLGLLLLLVSGLPWTGFWGAQAQQLATDRGGSLWSTDPGAISDPTSTLDESLPHSHAREVPWGMGKSEVPGGRGSASGESAGDGSRANVDTAVAVADREGLRHPVTVALPEADDGVFSVIGYAFDAPSQERTVHVDRFGGDVVSSYGFSDYPVLAKVVSQGIGLHEGRSLGLWSFWGAALMCVAVITSCVSGLTMWWRRRPAGSVGAPRGRMPVRSSPVLLGGLVVLGVLLPFFGLSLALVLALDLLVVRRVPWLSERLNAA